MVENLLLACAGHARGFHEAIADDLASQFPGTRQVLSAHHHGVDIETVRGEF